RFLHVSFFKSSTFRFAGLKQNIRKWLTGDSDRSCDSTEETSIIKRQAYQGKKNRNNLYTHLHYFSQAHLPLVAYTRFSAFYAIH
ncbi:hypothetical protein, partial [Hallella sp.]|uniref:hypothetical protein n=1 Tax=Hallella sp. TaxID=2980186 RepID=UPI00307901BF